MRGKSHAATDRGLSRQHPRLVSGDARRLRRNPELSLVAFFVAAVLGLFVALMRISPRPSPRWIAISFIEVMRGTPALVILYIVYFVPPQAVQQTVDNADVIHIHDEWTRKKFDEGKYKSSEIYGSPRDPALRKEYDEYLKKRLEEVRKK